LIERGINKNHLNDILTLIIKILFKIMSEEVQRIRQVVFLVENKIYKFDVNSQTSLKNLRKIIIAAANISNKVFKFFTNNKEIVAPDATTLDQLFHQEEEIVAQIIGSNFLTYIVTIVLNLFVQCV